MIHYKRFLAATTIVSMFFSNSIFAANVNMNLYYDGKMHHYQSAEVNIEINGETMKIEDMPPVILEDRTLVPARAVFETMGAEVAWNADTKEVYIKKQSDVVILKIDDEIGIKNGIAFSMDVPAKIVNDRTMIPVRAVSEAFGWEVGWDNKTRLVSITEAEEPEQPEQPDINDNINMDLDANDGLNSNTNTDTNNNTSSNTNTGTNNNTNSNTNTDTNNNTNSNTNTGTNNNTNSNTNTDTNNNTNSNTNTGTNNNGNSNTNTGTNNNGNSNISTGTNNNGNSNISTGTNNNANTGTNNNANSNTNTNNNGNNSTNINNSGNNSINTGHDTGIIPTENIKVTNITVPASMNAPQIFTISASNQIQKYQNVYVDDKRIVLDIYYAEKGLPNDNLAVTTSPFVASIRSAQHDMDGVIVTRVVLDLKSPIQYQLIQNNNTLVVSFQESIVQSLTKANSGTIDTITIAGSAPLATNISELFNPKRLVIDIPYATSNLEPNPSTEGLSQITAIRTSMYEEKTARVVLEMKDTAEYDIVQSGNNLIVTVKKSTLDNLSYDDSKKALVLKKGISFDINSVVHTDNYLNNQYQLALPGDFTNVYGYGTMKLPYEGVENVTVANAAGKTIFSFSESKIRAFTLTEDANNYYINIKNPKEVYSKVVLLDAGHGGNDPGTSGNGLNEKDITLSIVNKAYALLQNTDKVKVYLTRNNDSRPENRHRANTANDMADVLISIHMNSASPNPTPNGTEVLFITHSNDVQGRLTSQVVATVLLQKTVNALSTNNRGLKYDTQHQKNLILLNSTVIPSVIVETLFLSNPGDALKIANPANHDKMAQAIYDAILELANNYNWR